MIHELLSEAALQFIIAFQLRKIDEKWEQNRGRSKINF